MRHDESRRALAGSQSGVSLRAMNEPGPTLSRVPISRRNLLFFTPLVEFLQEKPWCSYDLALVLL